MTPQAVAALNMEVQGEGKELFARVQRPSITSRCTSRSSTSEVHLDRDMGTRTPEAFTSRPSTTGGHNYAQGHQEDDDILSHEDERETGCKRHEMERVLSDSMPLANADSSKGDGTLTKEKKHQRSANEKRTKLLGGYLRTHLMGNIDSPEPAKELVRRSFRHLHRGQGHILTFEEFKEGLTSTFGVLIPRQVIQATFEIFDTEPRTWQLDFDEFCEWLETGERSLNSHGVSAEGGSILSQGGSSKPKDTQAHKQRSHESLHGRKTEDVGMSMQQKDRAQLKAHLIKHKNRLNTSVGLTQAQKSVLDHILLEKIKAICVGKIGPASAEAFHSLAEFKAFASGSDGMTWNAFKRKVGSMLPDLLEESDVKEAFSRMDHNRDGVVDLADYLMWEERMKDGKANTDFWALQEEQHLEQLKLARRRGSNPLVPEDYDGSTYFAKIAREEAKKKRADAAAKAPENEKSRSREEMAQLLRNNIFSQVKGGPNAVLRAFRHFRPAAHGRQLFMDYTEFRESIKDKALGLSEKDIKKLFKHFDEDNSGEIDFSEFRRFLLGGKEDTGLQLGGNHHEKRKIQAAINRVAAIANSDNDPTLEGDAKFDQLLKAKVLRRITGGQSEVLKALRRFGTEEAEGIGSMDYTSFAEAIARAGFHLSSSETKTLFKRFRLTDECWDEANDAPTGEIYPHAFRDWLLESNIPTSLNVGNVVRENATEQINISDLHRKLREKVVTSLKSDNRSLLRAFRGITRKKRSEISIEEFREALKSFGLKEDKAFIEKLFDRYDWRRRHNIPFQELIEILTKDISPPRQLATAERKFRLNEEKKLSDEAISKLEDAIRTGLWKKYLDDVEACHRAISTGGLVGLTALQTAARIAGISGDRTSEKALKRLLRRNTDIDGCRGWNKADFIRFYRLEACRAAMPSSNAPHGAASLSYRDAYTKRTQLNSETYRARAQLLRRIQHLSDVLTEIDHSGTGKVSRKIFAKALTNDAGLGKVSEMELTRLFVRYKCSEQGGSYVHFPTFVANFTLATRSAEPDTLINAFTAAENTVTQLQSMASSPGKHGLRGPIRSASNPQLALLPPRPNTVASATNSGDGDRNSIDSRHIGIINQALADDVKARARTAELGRRRRVTELQEIESKAATSNPRGHGYLKLFGADSAKMEHELSMKATKSLLSLPNLVDRRSELPKTTTLHRAMKNDVMKNMNKLKSAFKECETPYRRGVVTVAQFQAVCRKNGVTVDKEDAAFLLKLHRHRLSYGGKYAVPPAWLEARSSTYEHKTHTAAATTGSLRYDEFLWTCQAASGMNTAPVQ